MASTLIAAAPLAAHQELLVKAELLEAKDRATCLTPVSTCLGSPEVWALPSEGVWDSEDGFALPEAEDSCSEGSDEEGVLRLRMAVRKFALAGARRAPRRPEQWHEEESSGAEESDEEGALRLQMTVRKFALAGARRALPRPEEGTCRTEVAEAEQVDPASDSEGDVMGFRLAVRQYAQHCSQRC